MKPSTNRLAHSIALPIFKILVSTPIVAWLTGTSIFGGSLEMTCASTAIGMTIAYFFFAPIEKLKLNVVLETAIYNAILFVPTTFAFMLAGDSFAHAALNNLYLTALSTIYKAAFNWAWFRYVGRIKK